MRRPPPIRNRDHVSSLESAKRHSLAPLLRPTLSPGRHFWISLHDPVPAGGRAGASAPTSFERRRGGGDLPPPMDIRGGQLGPQSPVAPPAPTAALHRARAALRPSERAPIPPSSTPPSNPDDYLSSGRHFSYPFMHGSPSLTAPSRSPLLARHSDTIQIFSATFHLHYFTPARIHMAKAAKAVNSCMFSERKRQLGKVEGGRKRPRT